MDVSESLLLCQVPNSQRELRPHRLSLSALRREPGEVPDTFTDDSINQTTSETLELNIEFDKLTPSAPVVKDMDPGTKSILDELLQNMSRATFQQPERGIGFA